jgi:hypothetical protein
MLRRMLTATLAAGLLLAMPGIARADAAGNPDDPEGAVYTAAGIDCSDWVRDNDPRDFYVFTIEDVPNNPLAGGGYTRGFVWVERRSDGRGYNVCVGWPTDAEPYPWMALLVDNEPDAHWSTMVLLDPIGGRAHR